MYWSQYARIPRPAKGKRRAGLRSPFGVHVFRAPPKEKGERVCALLSGCGAGEAWLAVDFARHDCDRLLIDACSIPFLNDAEIWLALLKTFARFPTFLPQVVGGAV